MFTLFQLGMKPYRGYICLETYRSTDNRLKYTRLIQIHRSVA